MQELAAADTAEIERNDKLIDRLRELATENAEQFRGKTLRARVKIQERLEERRIKAPFIALTEPDINFVTSSNLEDTIALEVNNYNVAFDELLLENVNFEIKSTDKVAIVGSGMRGIPGVMAKIYRTLQENNIEVLQTADSHMTIWCLIEDKQLENAVNALHKAFI